MSAAVASKGFDVLLVIHIVVAVAAFVVLCVLAAAGHDVRRGEPTSAARRSFTGRPEVAGRVVHLVPLSGIALLALSDGAFGFGTPFVVVGVVAWAVAAVCLEAVAFPAQHETARALDHGGDPRGAAARMVGAVELAAVAIAVAAIVMATAS